MTDSCKICCSWVTSVQGINMARSSANRAHLTGICMLAVISLMARLNRVGLRTEPRRTQFVRLNRLEY